MSFLDPFFVATPGQSLELLDLTGTATAADVKDGKTFFSTPGQLQTGTMLPPHFMLSTGGPAALPPPEKSKLERPLALTCVALLLQKKELKRQLEAAEAAKVF